MPKPMTGFTARFQLRSVVATKTARYVIRDDGTLDYSAPYTMEPSVTIEMGAVKDGAPEDVIYGQMSPYGEVKMTIANPDVAQELNALWQDYVTDPEKSTPPKFALLFVPAGDGPAPH